MATTYRTREGDIIDAICWRHYGRENAVINVLKANPGLADRGAVLASGIQIILPTLSTSVAKESSSLWD